METTPTSAPSFDTTGAPEIWRCAKRSIASWIGVSGVTVTTTWVITSATVGALEPRLRDDVLAGGFFFLIMHGESLKRGAAGSAEDLAAGASSRHFEELQAGTRIAPLPFVRLRTT